MRGRWGARSAVGLQLVEPAEDRRLEVEDVLLEALDALEDLAVALGDRPVALEQLDVLLLLDVSLARRVLQRHPVAERLAVAREEDQRRRVGRLRREREIQEDERVGIEVEQQHDVSNDPYEDDQGLDQNE